MTTRAQLNELIRQALGECLPLGGTVSGWQGWPGILPIANRVLGVLEDHAVLKPYTVEKLYAGQRYRLTAAVHCSVEIDPASPDRGGHTGLRGDEIVVRWCGHSLAWVTVHGNDTTLYYCDKAELAQSVEAI